MGTDIDREKFDDSDYARFAERLEECLSALGQLSKYPARLWPCASANSATLMRSALWVLSAEFSGCLEVAGQRGQYLRHISWQHCKFDRPAGVKFLMEVRRIIEPGDSLLLGTDLEKPAAQLLKAYDDELGVTAAFNLNLLARVNRELDADFDLSQFAHLAGSTTKPRSVEIINRNIYC